jgi:murein DD-endopeptidase MepM/ murein hydrolase activator NlpD
MKPQPLRTRLAFAGALACALGVIAAPLPAAGQSTQDRLNDARREATRIKSDIERIAESFATADDQQHNTEHQVNETQEEIDRVRGEIGGLQNKLKDRVRQAYRMKGVGFFQFLLEARSFRDFNLRLMSLQRQTLADEDLILQLRKKRSELDLKERSLAAQNAALKQRVADYEAQGRRATITLGQASALAARLKDQLTREQIAKLFSISRTTGGRVVSLSSCPVDPPNIVTNSWGAPRGGGTRRHQGNDIMADHGTPIRAVNSGTITRTGSGGLGGLSVYLWDGSTEYYYAHLSRISVSSGQKVAADTQLGANGDTGNASGGPPHLHFEIHPGGGGAIDPYPSLSVVC